FEEPDIIDFEEPEPEKEIPPQQPEAVEPEEANEPEMSVEPDVIEEQTPKTVEQEISAPTKEPEKTVAQTPVTKAPEETKQDSRPYLYDYAVNEVPKDEEESADDGFVKTSISDPDQADERGVTLLMKAAKAGNDWDVKNLLLNGADVSKRDCDGWTALMYAVRYQNNLQIVKTLIDHGAHTRVRNKYNSTPLLMAAEHSLNPEILALLLENRSSTEDEVFRAFMLTLSSTSGSMRIREAKIRLFLEDMAIPVNHTWQGTTPLIYAAQHASSTQIIKLLLDFGAKTSIRDVAGKTAFDYAKENKSLAHDEIYWSLNSKN
ncbi:MAG: ankyrin repeat domain-containing protein, partial [Treponema sp.]|nr:ankyrin repeat domain-containing protein [Treponema sp.]